MPLEVRLKETEYESAISSMRVKVQTIFYELVGERSTSLSENKLARDVIKRIKFIYTAEFGQRRASNLGLNMSHWSADAAFIVALHLFPERFSDLEIEAGINMFLGHAPNHIVTACDITERVITSVGEQDPKSWEESPGG